jgi:hypothetical protein
MASPADIRRQKVRALLVRARRFFSPDAIHRMAEDQGFKLSTKADNLRQFAAKEEFKYNLDDTLQLEQFFATDTGRIICGGLNAGATLAFLGETLKQSATHPDGRAIEGWYYGFHGSYLQDGHYVVRAIKITRDADGLLYVENQLQDTRSLHNARLKASGTLFFVDGKPHIVTYHRDNGRGPVLFVTDQVSPHDGTLIEKLTGQMLGMTQYGQYFCRAMLMLRVPTPRNAELSEDALLKQTGIHPIDAWPKNFQDHFQELKRQLPREVFPDPIRALP